MEKVLTFVDDPDINVLDRVVETVYRGTGAERDLAQKLLTKLQEHPNVWQRVDTILEFSKSQNTKYYALQILDNLIKYRWKMLPREQCTAIKGYIVGLIIKLSGSDESAQREKLFLSKLNLILIAVIKHEWPRNWENFIPEIVASSNTSESICENNLHILKLLSEEVFDFSGGQMTQVKIQQLKESLTKDFSLIYQLIERVLEHSTRPSLVSAALETLNKFLSWIPLGFIFETKLIDTLIYKFFPVPMFRNITLKCLTEIGSLSVGNVYDAHFARLYCVCIQALKAILPLETDIAAAYETGSQSAQDFIEDLSLFLTGFYRSHISVLESAELQQYLLEGHAYLAKISLVSDAEIFKICLEHWNTLSGELYNETPFLNTASAAPRRSIYAATLSRVRVVMIGRMAKPEEVLVVEDDNGEIIREVTKDVDAIILYKTMRETLIYLTHLDPDDTQQIMLEKLNNQVNGREWSWHNLNTLCWAIGSISGAMNEDDEKKFLVMVIKELLGLCEMKRGKDNKAVVASNIMYIVGQYPRFLRAHWKFLKTVVNKLFEFMHEMHPGVQDMACDTFLKISQKCRRKFVVVQVGESVPFIDEILGNLNITIADLTPSQIHTFYEAVGYMISSHTDAEQRDALIVKLMNLPNMTWTEIMGNAARSLDYLRNPEIAKSLTNILKTNTRAATSLGHCYIVQLGRLFMDMLNVYKVYSDSISQVVATGGPHATAMSNVRAMRSVKKEVLKLLETFISRSEDPPVVYTNFVPPLLQHILVDYKTIRPETRDAEVLSLLTAILTRLKTPMTNDVPRILDHVFEATLSMITQNFEDHPDHRQHFFNLIRAINTYCFPAFFLVSQQHFKLVIDSIVWGFKHPTRNIAETGMWILLELWKNISQSEVAQPFYQSYLLRLLTDIFGVLTDSFHKSALKLHSMMLLQMIDAVESGQVTAPLWDPAVVTEPGMTNPKFLRDHLFRLLSSSFPNLTPQQLQLFVAGLFAHCHDLPSFKNHLRDFLVQLREFVDKDNSELFAEEAEAQAAAIRDAEKKKLLAIPGMIAPQNQPTWNADLDMA